MRGIVGMRRQQPAQLLPASQAQRARIRAASTIASQPGGAVALEEGIHGRSTVVCLSLWKASSRTERQVIEFLLANRGSWESRCGVGVRCGKNVVFLETVLCWIP